MSKGTKDLRCNWHKVGKEQDKRKWVQMHYIPPTKQWHFMARGVRIPRIELFVFPSFVLPGYLLDTGKYLALFSGG